MLHRIQRRDTFKRLQNPLRSARSGCVGAKWVESRPGEESPAVGFAIPRHFGTAVVRNRVRRQLRHLLLEMERVDRIRHGQYLITVRSPRSSAPAETTKGRCADHDSLKRDLYSVITALDVARQGELEVGQ